MLDPLVIVVLGKTEKRRLSRVMLLRSRVGQCPKRVLWHAPLRWIAFVSFVYPATITRRLACVDSVVFVGVAYILISVLVAVIGVTIVLDIRVPILVSAIRSPRVVLRVVIATPRSLRLR